MIPALLSVIIAFGIMGTAIVQITATNLKLTGDIVKNQQAFNIAEAGLNYYMWHLNHNSADYKDGKTTPTTPDPNLGYGPYSHNYVDANGVTQGTYTLWIKPAGAGSTIATIRSIGKTADGGTTRTVLAKVGKPSFASYGLVINGPLYVGDTSTITGPIHSNVGVRMDGAGNDDVTSANQTYVPPSNLGGNGTTSRPGVWCGAGTDCTQKNATNNNGIWRYPVASVDFAAITGDMCTIKKLAFAADASTAALTDCSQVPTTRTAAYVPRAQTALDTTKGYLIELNPSTTYPGSPSTYNLYKVTNETYTYTSNTNYTYPYTAALTRTLVASNIAIPASNVIFVEDNVWVRTNPTFHGRVTIASGRLASTSESTDIVIADDVKYSTKNGEDAIGLVAENSVMVAPYAPPRPSDAASNYPFEINAAIIARDGSNGIFTNRYKLATNNSNTAKTVPQWTESTKPLLYFGSAAAEDIAAWATGTSGFQYRQTTYDSSLLYAPPPSFPTTGGYQIMSWRQIITKP